MFSRSFVLFLVLFVSFSCSTKKIKDQAGSEKSELQKLESKGIQFEVSGDSDSGKAGGLSTIYFDFNSAILNSEIINKLNKNLEVLKNNPSLKIQIEGHCDERGSVQFNLALGEKRARNIFEYLENNGINKTRLAMISFGKERPVSYGHEEDSWAKNRRANFVITSK